MGRKINDALIPDRRFVVSVYYDNECHPLTTVVYAKTAFQAEEKAKQKPHVIRAIVRSEING